MKFPALLLTLFVITFQLQAQNWHTDLEGAQSEATKSKKNIVLVFQGSDWCAPCKKLDKEIWSTSEFQQANQDHFVMLQADFPRKKKNRLSKEQRDKNSRLAEKYNREGIFPLVVVMNAEGKVLGKTGYKKFSPTEYYNHLVSLEK